MPEILEWCFDEGFTMPQASTSNGVYNGLYCSLSTEICQVLIEHDVDLNKFSLYRGTVFPCAVEMEEVKTVGWLLENG
jgi:hypothetical protein